MDLRNLPDAVRERLVAANVDLDRRHRGFDIDYKRLLGFFRKRARLIRQWRDLAASITRIG